MTNKKEFITKDAEIKYLRDRVSYLELENENLRLKLKLAETEKPRPKEKKRKRFLVDPFWGWEIPIDPALPGPFGYEINDFPWWFRTGSTSRTGNISGTANTSSGVIKF